MTTGTVKGPTKGATERLLKSAEWMADNAYIAPGMHRLLMASGLLAGLWGARQVMDVITARNARTGKDIARDDVPQMLRALHGLMTFNPYSDNASDRWKNVVNKLAPSVGVVGAYAGSRYFFHSGVFHPAATNVLADAKAGNATLETTQSMLSLTQADWSRKLGAVSYAFGSATGLHWFGGLLLPFNPNVNAAAFQQAAAIKNNVPFAGWFNRVVMGNYSAASRDLYPALRNTLKSAEANLVTQGAFSHWGNQEGWMARHVQDALQIFPKVTDTEKTAFAKTLRGLLDGAQASAAKTLRPNPGKDALSKHVQGYLNGANPEKIGLTGAPFERLLMKSGLDLREMHPTDYGILTGMSRLIGSIKGERVQLAKYGEHLRKDYGLSLGKTADGVEMTGAQWAENKITMPVWKAASGYGLTAAGVTGALAAGSVSASRMDKRIHREPNGTLVEELGDIDKPEKQENSLAWVNRKPLAAAEWLSRIAITPPSLHRFMNAAYLSLALWGGMTVANVVTGRKLTLLRSGPLAGSVLTKEMTPKLLRPLHNLMPYTPGSDVTRDRALQASHYIFPVIVGALGSYTGSWLFFKDRIHKLETPKTLEDYTDKIMLEQSKPYAILSAVTSIFNTGSGIYLLPGFNYSANMQNRYLMAAGQQVAMPGLGKLFSGNAGLTPWGVKGTLTYMSKYLTNNPDARLREMPALLHSVIGKLYPDLPDEQLLVKKQAVLNQIYTVRDSYLVDGHIPEAKKPELKKAMTKLISGFGFESLLVQADLNPAEANLASNGLSGGIANSLGKRHKVHELQTQYRKNFAERVAKQGKEGHSPSDYLRALADHSGDAVPAANDNPRATPLVPQPDAAAASFIKRAKTEAVATGNFVDRVTAHAKPAEQVSSIATR